MVYDGMIKGKYVYLKSAVFDDAEFTLSIRNDPEITRYLPKIDITIDQQRKWILTQNQLKGDYFFVVRNYKDECLGTIGVYDIKDEQGEGGRLALYGDPYEKIEAGILMGDFEFDILNLKKTVGWVYEKNKHAMRWNRNFGATFSDVRKLENGDEIRDLVITRDNFRVAREKLCNLIYR